MSSSPSSQLRTKDWLRLPIPSIAAALRAGEVTSVQLVEESLRRLRESQERVNAVTHFMAAPAQAAAREADEKFRSGKAGSEQPLLGIPCTVKSALAIQGQPLVSGLWYRRNAKAESTAPGVQRYLDAGAIPVALTNVPEALTWVETSNRVYGRTDHPTVPGRTCGGSSGGEAAAIALGAVPFGLGTDMGASIRLPSVFCGISGHKPTPGLVPVEGLFPEPFGRLREYSVVGPMARHARDLPLLLSVLSGKPLNCFQSSLAPGQVRVYWHADNGEARCAPEVRETLRLAAEKLQALGCKVEKWHPKEFARSTWLWMSRIGVETDGPAFRQILGGPDADVQPARELLRFLTGRSHHTFPGVGLAVIESVLKGKADQKLRKGAEDAAHLAEDLRQKLGDDGVILGPVYPTRPPRHGRMPFTRPFGFTYGGIYNVLGMPATALGTRDDGITPLGAQVAAGPGQDALSLTVAGWMAPDREGDAALDLGSAR